MKQWIHRGSGPGSLRLLFAVEGAPFWTPIDLLLVDDKAAAAADELASRVIAIESAIALRAAFLVLNLFYHLPTSHRSPDPPSGACSVCRTASLWHMENVHSRICIPPFRSHSFGCHGHAGSCAACVRAVRGVLPNMLSHVSFLVISNSCLIYPWKDISTKLHDECGNVSARMSE